MKATPGGTYSEVGVFLKREVRTQLQGTTILRRSSSQGVDRGSSRRDCAITTATGGQQPGGWANVETLIGQSQGRMVEGVVGVGTHFQVNPFREVEGFAQSKVGLFEAGAGELITVLVSKGS